MNNSEIAEKIAKLTEEIQEHNPHAASILYAVCGALEMNVEDKLCELTHKFSRQQVQQIKYKDN